MHSHNRANTPATTPVLNKFYVSNSTTSEFRRADDPNDNDRRKGDLTTYGLFDDGATVLDVGITHPTIDSSISSLSSEVRAAGANAYATTKAKLS